MKFIIILYAIITLCSGHGVEDLSGCAPECRYACSDPVCYAKAYPSCAEPDCSIFCYKEDQCGDCRIQCEEPVCEIRCPVDHDGNPDQCSLESCPACETVCEPSVCILFDCDESCTENSDEFLTCSPLCESTNCNWLSTEPDDCPEPECVLQCQSPACECVGDDCTVLAQFVSGAQTMSAHSMLTISYTILLWMFFVSIIE